MIGLLVGAGILACVVLFAVKTTPERERVSRMLNAAEPEFDDRELDLLTWNDGDLTYAVHGHRSRRGRVTLWTEADREDHAADIRLARWNRAPPPPIACGVRRD